MSDLYPPRDAGGRNLGQSPSNNRSRQGHDIRNSNQASSTRQPAAGKRGGNDELEDNEEFQYSPNTRTQPTGTRLSRSSGRSQGRSVDQWNSNDLSQERVPEQQLSFSSQRPTYTSSDLSQGMEQLDLQESSGGRTLGRPTEDADPRTPKDYDSQDMNEDDEDDSEGLATPPKDKEQKKRSRGSRRGRKHGSQRQLDKSFKIQNKPKEFFVPGTVIKACFIQNAGNLTQKQAKRTVTTANGQSVAENHRRFIILRVESTHCMCLGITTFDGRGGKPSVPPDMMTAVYIKDGPEPIFPKDVKKPTLESIEMIPDNPDIKLDGLSRIDIGRDYTIEYNVRVKRLGQITQSSMNRLKSYHRAVWKYD